MNFDSYFLRWSRNSGIFRVLMFVFGCFCLFRFVWLGVALQNAARLLFTVVPNFSCKNFVAHSFLFLFRWSFSQESFGGLSSVCSQPGCCCSSCVVVMVFVFGVLLLLSVIIFVEGVSCFWVVWGCVLGFFSVEWVGGLGVWGLPCVCVCVCVYDSIMCCFFVLFFCCVLFGFLFLSLVFGLIVFCCLEVCWVRLAQPRT